MSMLRVPVSPHDHIDGDPNAPATLVEYGDYECSHCGAAYPVVLRVQQHFGNDLCFVYRHFPLTEVHPHAEPAAEAAEAAGAQGKFWPMHDLLFEHASQLKPKDLRRHAERLELDLARFDFEIGDQVYRQRVNEHREGGKKAGV